MFIYVAEQTTRDRNEMTTAASSRHVQLSLKSAEMVRAITPELQRCTNVGSLDIWAGHVGSMAQSYTSHTTYNFKDP